MILEEIQLSDTELWGVCDFVKAFSETGYFVFPTGDDINPSYIERVLYTNDGRILVATLWEPGRWFELDLVTKELSFIMDLVDIYKFLDSAILQSLLFSKWEEDRKAALEVMSNYVTEKE